MTGVDAVLLVVALTLGAALGARRLRTPMPVVLALSGVVAGQLWHLVPHLPPVALPPERVLFIFLPPLLTSAAYALPFGAVRRNARAILLLAVGLVLATIAGTAAVARALAGLPWAAALVLGAIVAPPDPVAATAVAEETGLAHRFVIVLEGEGLVNDAVAIVAYNLAVQAVAGGDVGWGHIGLGLLREAPVGVVVGLALGWCAVALRRRVDDVTIEAGVSLFAPYLTYEVADRLGGSAVLAVVTFGFYLQRHTLTMATNASRLAARTVWSAVSFVSTAAVFFLLGLLLGEVATFVLFRRHALPAAGVAATVIVLRLAWMYAVPQLTQRLPHAAWAPAAPTWRERTVLGWAGMRGVVSLALALALPPFPGAAGADQRTTVVVIAFGVILATLGLQGLTLLPLVTAVGAGDPERAGRDERRIRTRARRAGLAGVARWAGSHGVAPETCAELERSVSRGGVGVAEASAASARDLPLGAMLAALDAQRTVVEGALVASRIGTSLAARLQTELDVDAMRLRGDAGRLTTDVDG